MLKCTESQYGNRCVFARSLIQQLRFIIEADGIPVEVDVTLRTPILPIDETGDQVAMTVVEAEVCSWIEGLE